MSWLLLLFSLLITLQTCESSLQTLPKAAICCLTKRSHQLQTWISHYLDHLNATTVYLYLDHFPGIETELEPQLQPIREQYGSRFRTTIVTRDWLARNRIYHANSTRDRSAENRMRQAGVSEDALLRSREDGIDWLFHVDIDELIHIRTGEDLPHFLDRFNRQIDPEKRVHTVDYANWELIPERTDYSNCFKEGNLFRTKNRGYIAYANGKGGARVNGRTHTFGAHRFRSDDPSALSLRLRDEEFVVLHYVCCNTGEFISKYRNLGVFSNNGWEWASFHREARDRMYACREDKTTNNPIPLGAPMSACEQKVVEEMFAKRQYVLPRDRPYILVVDTP
jgi:hypothetical protein